MTKKRPWRSRPSPSPTAPAGAVYVLTVDSIGSQTIRDFAKAYYTDHALGYGDGRNGILFCISMEGRDYVTVTYGLDPDDPDSYGIGITAFSDARIQALEDAVVPSLSDGDYAGAFSTYLDTCANYLETPDAGSEDYTNYDSNDGSAYHSGFYFPLSHLAIAFLIAFVIALIVCLISARPDEDGPRRYPGRSLCPPGRLPAHPRARYLPLPHRVPPPHRAG